MKAAITLIHREWLLETRHKHALGGILLYILSTVFVCYLSFEKIMQTDSWNALLWIILLFVTTNATNNSFNNESGKKLLYTYTLISPQSLILAKMIYNAGLNTVLCFIAYAVYSLLLGNFIIHQGLFFLTIALGSSGFSFLLTMNAAIISKTDNNAAMMAILSFPLVLPLLLTLIKITKIATMNISWLESGSLLLTLMSLNLLIATLAYLLFPYLWRE